MSQRHERFDPRVRAEEKDRSRRSDERALAAGRVSAAELRRENAAFGAVARSGRANLARSRSLG